LEAEVEVEMETQLKDKSGSRSQNPHHIRERMSMERGSSVLLRDFDEMQVFKSKILFRGFNSRLKRG